ncbi:hypothetical protein CWATWH0005_28 [Crocosphaera watsonii WH 0005]|uniref:Uncharacterized protein n=1 Tax=Crocosphaera watsonii WH 0005 TaxID=423472 RepID=T2IZL7_CROWT|nr:hypothetical protein CWATWH0005_28 [Crocosphaera watsonii WH 0005]
MKFGVTFRDSRNTKMKSRKLEKTSKNPHIFFQITQLF